MVVIHIISGSFSPRPFERLIDIDGETVNVATAANLAMVTAYVLYAKDVFSKLSKLVLSKTSGTPEQTGGTTPPALEEPADAAEATAAE